MDNVTATVGTSKKYAREDHIHPLNKNYFLTDETAAALGLGDNPTVDEALGVLKKDVDNVEKVGDIKTTVRTDLGDDWLLCNGEAVNTEEYPGLKDLLPTGAVLGAEGVYYRPTSSTVTTSELFSGVAYGGGKYVLVVTPGGSSAGNTHARVRVSTSLTPASQSMTTVMLPATSGGTNTINKAYDIAYVDGVFIVCGSASPSSSTNYPVIWTCSDDPAIQSNWTLTNLDAGGAGGGIACSITYEQGLIVIGGYCDIQTASVSNLNHGYPTIWYTSALSSGFTRKQLTSTVGAALQVKYRNGLWLAVPARVYSVVINQPFGCKLLSCPTVDGEWTETEIYSGSTSSLCGIDWDGEKWVACLFSNSSSTFSSSRLITAESLAGAWTTTLTMESKFQPTRIVFDGGYWLCLGGNAWTTSSYGSYTQNGLWVADKTLASWANVPLAYDLAPVDMFKDGEYTYFLGWFRTLYSMSSVAGVEYVEYPAYVCPTITTEGAYNYIKGR